MTFLPLVALLAAFVVLHVAVSRPRIRDPLRARLGAGGYGAFHGVVSAAGLAAVFWAYFGAPYLELWPPREALRGVPHIVLPPACIFFFAAVTTRCAGLGGDKLPEGENPAPGILSITRHPIPWALILWAGAHVSANGDLASLLLFGTFLIFAAAPALVDRRRRRVCGEADWQRFAMATATLPFAGPGPVGWNGIGRGPVAGGLALYIALMLSHEAVIGVSPWP